MDTIRITKEQNPKQVDYFYKVWEEVDKHEKNKVALGEWRKRKYNLIKKHDLSQTVTWDELKEQTGVDIGEKPRIYKPIRNFFYGGAIRGGKTFISLAILSMLAKKYKESRWHVIRRSFSDLLATTIPSMEKLLGTSRVRWKRNPADYFVEFENGSKIYFWSESFTQDKDLNRFKGLETNGVLLEQIEELQEKTFNKCLERVGSWYPPNIPPAFIFATFNPTYNWVKERFHDKWGTEGVEDGYYYMTALPSDNASVTDDQYEQWNKMDEKTRARYIEGKWEIEIEDVFMHTFRSDLHTEVGCDIDPNLPVWFSMDFNVNPMTCIMAQTDYKDYCRVLKEFRVPNSDTYELCRLIKEYLPLEDFDVRITGDASGKNAMSGARGHINHYDIIHKELGVPWNSFILPTVNPFISDSRTFCNSFFHSFPNFKIDAECKHLVKDLMYVYVGNDAEGKIKIQKTGMNEYANIDNSMLGHLLDCLRYFLHNAHPNYIKIPKS